MEGFFPCINQVSELVRNTEFKTTIIAGEEYTGVGECALPVKPSLERLIGRPVSIKFSHIRLGTKDTPLTHYIHRDLGGAKYTLVAYLSEPNCITGTAFWTHKSTGIDVANPQLPGIETALQEIDDEDKWKMNLLVGSKLNRAVIFNSQLFHSRYPKDLQISIDDPRIVVSTFFDIL